MNVKQPTTSSWSALGDVITCQLNDEAFEQSFGDGVVVHLRIDEILEEFEGRRVLVASAQKVTCDGDESLAESIRDAVLRPTYLVEETRRIDEDDRDWPDELRDLVRLPLVVEVEEGVKRSIFVDNVGISVGDLIDLVRGELKVNQIEAIFRAVAELFQGLHDEEWVHLGLTPWNVRIFDEEHDDAFLQGFLSEAFSEEDPDVSAAMAKWDEADGPLRDDDSVREQPEQDPEFSERDKTLVELEPLGDAAEQEDSDERGLDDSSQPNLDGSQDDDGDEKPAGDEPAETDQGDDAAEDSDEVVVERTDAGLAASSLYDSSVSWSEIAGETSPIDTEEQGRDELAAILDGIDRLYKAGRINDEVAVTPGFSAPELLSGLGTRDGVTADVFSLGMFLYFLVAGVVPPASVYTRYAPAIPARNFRPDVPPGLQTVIARATRPQPEDRFPSVRALVEAFEDACEVMRRRRERAASAPPAARLASDTHIGIAKRRSNPTNQDSVFSGATEDGRFSLIVVADGVSTASYGSGDLASNALTEVAADVWSNVLPTYLMDEELDEFEIISEILERANKRIIDHVNENFTPFKGSPHEVMGSTALVALVVDGVVTLASLGDSRVYLQRGAAMEQLTIDHNLWTLSILEGVDADTALSMPHGDALARCLGTFVVEDQELVAVEPNPDLFRFNITNGDTLLLTTDGLVDFAGTNQLAAEDNILAILLAEPDPALACLELILLANRGGGGDNIGLSVVRME